MYKAEVVAKSGADLRKKEWFITKTSFPNELSDPTFMFLNLEAIVPGYVEPLSLKV